MKIIFAGTPDFAATALSALVDAGHDVCLVLTQPDRASGRGMKLTPSAVKTTAQAHGIPVLTPSTLRPEKGGEESLETCRQLESQNADLLVVAAYGLIIPQKILDMPSGIGPGKAIKAINKSGYLAIVVSNQPVIARGECSFEELQSIHDKMETELGKEGAFIDAIYYCPHHPDKGFEGERPEFKILCNCRKPMPGLLLKAAEDWNIDLQTSFIIGDSVRDVEAGKNAYLKDSLQVETSTSKAFLSAVIDILQRN